MGLNTVSTSIPSPSRVPSVALEQGATYASPLASRRETTAGTSVFTFRHGGFDISVIRDGYLEIPGDIFTPGVALEQRNEVLRRLPLVVSTVRAPTNIPILRSKDELILFDVGGGDRYQSTDGRFLHNLRSAGFDLAAVTKIVVAHAHPDHTGAVLGLDGRLIFPNATYFVGATEWDYWMDPDFFSRAPDAMHEFGRGAQRDLGAIKDRAVMLKLGHDIVGGIGAIDTAGHTPGHLSFEIAGGDGLIIAADTATSEVIGLEHPDWHFGYDSIPDLAVRSRKRLLDRASRRQDQNSRISLDLSRTRVRGSSRRSIPLRPRSLNRGHQP